MKLLNVTSEQAEMLSWFHAFVAPIITTVFMWLLVGSYEGVLSGSIYIMFLTTLNVGRLLLSNKPFEHEKSYMYFNSLKYLFVIVFIVSVFLVATLYGAHHV